MCVPTQICSLWNRYGEAKRCRERAETLCCEQTSMEKADIQKSSLSPFTHTFLHNRTRINITARMEVGEKGN